MSVGAGNEGAVTDGPGGTLRRWTGVAAACVSALLVTPLVLPAQEVRGRVVDEGTGEPVSGVFVSLLALPSGERADATLTSKNGAYVIQAPAAGRYRLRAERIGYEARETGPVELRSEQTVSRDLELPLRPVEIEGLRVTIDGRCRPSAEVTDAARRLWEDARAVLRTARWAERQERYRFTLLEYQETVVPSTGRIVEASARRRSGVRGAPFRSLPAEELARSGFRQLRSDTTRYYAPDADVLLSPAFRETHCLGVASEEDAPAGGLVGLSFRPSGEWGEVDVRGTFWFSLDPPRLRELRFTYTGLPGAGGGEPYGGRIGFRRLPDGGWIVDRWSLRMPHRREVEAGEGGGSPASRAYVESGGRVSGIIGPDGSVAGRREGDGGGGPTVSGHVLDELRGVLASGVRVFSPGTGRWTVTDALGRYRLQGVPAGQRKIRAALPLAELAGAGPVADSVVVRDGGNHRVDLSTPPLDEWVGRLCEETVEPPVLLVGWVTDRRGRPLAGARVTASWMHQVLSVSPGGTPQYSQRIRDREATARRDGSYALCGVTYDQEVEVRAEWQSSDGPATAVHLPRRGVARADPVGGR